MSDQIQTNLGYTFSRHNLLKHAITHSSFVHEQKLDTSESNERLEFLGDAVLSLCVTELLLRHAFDADEGALTRMRASLVNTVALARFADSVRLSRWVKLGKGAARGGDALQPKVLACVVEAVIAAVYVDQGLEGARRLIWRIVGESFQSMSRISRRDPKSELQERVQGVGRKAPTYECMAGLSPDDNGCFHVEVRVENDILGYGQGRSKKAAEQAAAYTALEKMAHSREESP
jgi:ribonuclease-3